MLSISWTPAAGKVAPDLAAAATHRPSPALHFPNKQTHSVAEQPSNMTVSTPKSARLAVKRKSIMSGQFRHSMGGNALPRPQTSLRTSRVCFSGPFSLSRLFNKGAQPAVFGRDTAANKESSTRSPTSAHLYRNPSTTSSQAPTMRLALPSSNPTPVMARPTANRYEPLRAKAPRRTWLLQMQKNTKHSAKG